MGKSINLQDTVLNQVRKEGMSVTLYLVGNIQLKGYVRGFDAFSLLFEAPGKPIQLVYKHAIVSILPSQQISGYRPANTGGRESDDTE
ncbi:MAG: RNA chaperone Hfq [Fimbriimonadales bacterium]